jgi:integrase
MSRKSWNYEDIEPYRTWFKGQTTGTTNKNARKLKQFCDWLGKSPETLLQEYEATTNKRAWQRDCKNQIQAFYNHLLSIGYKVNTARTNPSGILAFYSRNCETIKDATKLFAPPQIPENELIFTQEMLRKTYYYSDLEGQTFLSLAVCLGYSAIDFLNVEAEKLQNLVKEATDKGLEFIQFIGKSRTKTSVQPRSHLTPEALHSLKDYLAVLEKKYGVLPKFLWCNENPDRHLTNEGLNKRLKRILKSANIETYGKKVRFHLFRKFLYSHLQAKNRDIAKVITAKKVSASDLTYVPNLDSECLRVFKETYKEIALNGDLTGKTKQKQEQRIHELETQVTELKTFIKVMTMINEKETITKAIAELKKQGYKENFVFGDKDNIHYTNEQDKDDSFVMERTANALDYVNKLVEIQQRKQKKTIEK